MQGQGGTTTQGGSLHESSPNANAGSNATTPAVPVSPNLGTSRTSVGHVSAQN